MPKDQRTKWREAKQRYREKQRSDPPQETEEDDGGNFWTS